MGYARVYIHTHIYIYGGETAFYIQEIHLEQLLAIIGAGKENNHLLKGKNSLKKS